MSYDDPMDRGDEALCQDAAEQRKAERVVLSFLLDERPAQLTIPELCRELYAHPGYFKAEDVIERAVRDLVGCGLLVCDGAFVAPSQAAIRFALLEVE